MNLPELGNKFIINPKKCQDKKTLEKQTDRNRNKKEINVCELNLIAKIFLKIRWIKNKNELDVLYNRHN